MDIQVVYKLNRIRLIGYVFFKVWVYIKQNSMYSGYASVYILDHIDLYGEMKIY